MSSYTREKLEYLAETKNLIRLAINGKGQSVSETDTFRSYADAISAIEAGGGESDILLPTTELTFTENPDYGNMWLSAPALCELEVGKKYVVTWDGTDYTCEGVDLSDMMEGAVAIGNLAFVGGPDTGEPFALAYDPGTQADGVVYDSNICLTGDTNTHYIKIAKAPKTLTVKTGTFKTPDANTFKMNVTHGMGEIPDIIIIWINKPLTSMCIDTAVGFSSAMYEALGDGKWGFMRNAMDIQGTLYVASVTIGSGFEGTEGAMQGMIRSVNATTFTIGGETGTYKLITTAPYNWMAIGGITG